MTDRKKRRLARIAGHSLIGATVAYSVYDSIRATIARNRFLKAMAEDSDRHDISEYIKDGTVPRELKIIQDKKKILEYLNRESDNDSDNPFSKYIKRMTNRNLADQVERGTNAFFISGSGGDPTIAVGPGKLQRSLVAHEVGHYLSANKRDAKDMKNAHKKYMSEYYRGFLSEANPINIFRDPPMKNGDKLTRLGMENEAWDNAGGDKSKIKKELREAALGTYKSTAASRSMLIPTALAISTAIPLYAYSMGKL